MWIGTGAAAMIANPGGAVLPLLITGSPLAAISYFPHRPTDRAFKARRIQTRLKPADQPTPKD